MNNYTEQIFGVNLIPKAIYKQRSELQRYAVCPRQAILCEEHSDEIEIHEVLPETGQIVHAIAKEAIEACEYNLQEAADYFAEELPKARPDLQPEALRAGKNLANELRRFGSNRVLICEEPVTRSLLAATPERGEVLIVCELDLVLATTKENTIIVLDYKTGYKNRTNQEARDDFQTCVNSWCLFGKYPDVRTIHFFYLNTRINTRSYARIEKEDEPNIATRIFETAQYWLEDCDDAWPEPTKCSQCDVVRWCKIADHEIKALDDDPKLYLDIYITKQAHCDEMLKAMKAYVKNGKIIYGTKARFSFEPKPRFLPKIFETNEPNPEPQQEQEE